MSAQQDDHSYACQCELQRLNQSESLAQPLCLRQVIGVIRRKCMFKNRPRAIITKPEPPVRRQQ